MDEPPIIPASTKTLRTLVDGSLVIQVMVEPSHAMDAFKLLGEPGVPIAIARLTAESANDNYQRSLVKQSPYGQEAKALKLSGFFRAPEVWRAAGSDDQFRAWVQRQPSAISGEYSEYLPNGEGRCIAAHVRRSNESGTGHKAPYACIPLTQIEEHHEQHTHGEQALKPAEWWDKTRIACVEQWAWDAVKEALGYASMADVPPIELQAWAERAGVERFLPREYR